MSLTPIRPNPAPTFSDDWKPAISASPFASVILLNSSAIFRKCDFQELGRLALVCKAIRFFSEANEVWQDKYLERWSISLKWVGNLPDCWKAKVQKLFELMDEDEPHLSWSDMFWEHGLANAAISEAQKNLAQASKKRWYPQQSLRAKEAGVGLVFSKDLIKAPSREEIKLEKIELIFFEMLNLITCGKYEKLFSLYLESRKGFIQCSTLKGWWICRVLIRLYQAKKINLLVPKEQQIHLPNEPGVSSSNHFLSYFLGLNRFWLDQGTMLLAFPTLNCLRQLWDRTVDFKGIVNREARKEMIYQMELDYDRFYLTQYEMRPSELDDFAIKRMIIYLRAGFLDKAKQLLSLIVSETEDPIRWNELLGEAYLGSKVQGEDYPQSADTAFEKALGLLPIQDRKGREHFKRKLLQATACFILERDDAPSSLVAKVLERFYVDYSSLQQILDQLSIYEIICPLKVIINYEKAMLYPSFLRYLKSIRISRLKSPLSEKIQLCVLQIQLRILQKDFEGAVACWLSLYYLERKIPQEAPGELSVAAKWLYELIEQDQGIVQELVELDPKNPYSRLALAYRCYLKDDLEQAFEIIKKIAQLVELDDLEWLARLSQTNFEAFIVYSYVYSDEVSLKDYFENQMHAWFNNRRNEIYHNLAVRLYFEGHIQGALENLEYFKEGNDHTESHILRYLIGEKIGNEEMMRKAFKRVLVLTNDVLLVDDREFLQDQLFILG